MTKKEIIDRLDDIWRACENGCINVQEDIANLLTDIEGTTDSELEKHEKV